MTPLIDVVFILLLFFMLVSQFHRWQTLRVSTAVQDSTQGQHPAVLVRVQAEGQLDLNGEPLSLAALSERLGALRAKYPQLRVQVQAADAVSLQTLVNVFDQLQAAGVENLVLR